MTFILSLVSTEQIKMKLENTIWWVREEVIGSIGFGLSKALECMRSPKKTYHERKKMADERVTQSRTKKRTHK